MALKPTLISQTGDWFLQTRLPEFKINWREAKGKTHPLEIIGRQLTCSTHTDSSLSGFIHLSQPGGNRLPCLELQSHWPAIFTAGTEYLALIPADVIHSIGNVVLLSPLPSGPHSSNNLNQARKHIQATMIHSLAKVGLALEDSRYRRTYSRGLGNSELREALRMLETVAGLGQTKLVDPAQLAAFYQAAQAHKNPKLRPPYPRSSSSVHGNLYHLIATWKYPDSWPPLAPAPATPENNTAVALSL